MSRNYMKMATLSVHMEKEIIDVFIWNSGTSPESDMWTVICQLRRGRKSHPTWAGTRMVKPGR